MLACRFGSKRVEEEIAMGAGTRRVWALIAAAAVVLGAAIFAGCGSSGGGGGSDSEKGGTIALLLPETKTTRYEEQDKPNFERRGQEPSQNCKVVYSKAKPDPPQQQQQAEAPAPKGAEED